MDAIAVSGVSRWFGDVMALDDVTVGFAMGRITGLLGRNGAGKTTLIDLMSGRAPTARGTVRVLGSQPYEQRSVRRLVCAVSEAQPYPPAFRVDTVLTAARRFYPNWDDAVADDLVDAFTLRRRQKVGKLSRGQRSAVGVVIGIASRAPVTIFDEPYVGLDAVARDLFYERLVSDVCVHPRAIVMSSHLIDEVADLFDDVVVIDRGRIVLEGSAEGMRGAFAEIVGPTVSAMAFVDGLEVLRRRDLGGVSRITVRGADPSAARAQGLTARPLSLQEAVIALASTTGGSQTRHDPPSVGVTS